jgi:hypothetical protein
MEAGFPPQNRLGNMPHIASPKEEDRSHSSRIKRAFAPHRPILPLRPSFLFRAFKTAPPAANGFAEFSLTVSKKRPL